MKILTVFFLFIIFITSCQWDLDYIEQPPPDNCWTNQDCRCGEDLLFDSRDGQVYETVWVDEDGGNDLSKDGQCWMKQNLNVGEEVLHKDSVKIDTIIQKYCYYNDCDLYGGYYLYNEAMDDDPDVKGICPEGWHLPSLEEFEQLIIAADNDVNALLRIGGNITGFSADLCGLITSDGNGLYSQHAGSFGYYRSSTPGPDGRVVVLGLDVTGGEGVDIYGDTFDTGAATLRKVGICIRCVKD